MKRSLIFLAVCFVIWLGVKGCWRLGVLTSHRNAPKATWNALVLDQFGAPIPDARIEVIHTYIAAVPLSGEEIRRDEVKEFPKVERDGHFSFQNPRNLTRGITVIKVSSDGFVPVELPITAYDKDQIEGPPIWKIMLWKRQGRAPGAIHHIKDGGGNERVTIRPEWDGSPLLLNLHTKRFGNEGGELEFTIQRATANDPNKEDQAFEIKVRSIDGVLHSCSREDYESMFHVGVPAWGDTSPVVLSGSGTRGHPNATLHCTFSSHQGQMRGRASFYIDLIGESFSDAPGTAKIRFNFQAFWTEDGSQVLGEEL